jgi:HK97 family phage portal protein
MADLQFVESSQMSKTQIANIFKLPPSYIGGSVGDSLTYATVESNRIWLATQTLSPLCDNVAKFLSRDMSLFPFQSWHASFDMSELLRGDSAARANYYEKGLKNGWLDVDEVRQAEHLPPKAEVPPPPPPEIPDAFPPELMPPVRPAATG